MLTILMPVAGAGSRFAAAGDARPKPLIEIHGRPMAWWPLQSVRAEYPDARVVFVVLCEHEEKFGIIAALRKLAPEAQFAVANQLTGGSLQSCMLARPLVAEGALLVLDCDLAFRAPAYFRQFRAMTAGASALDGVLLSFRSDKPIYSYAEVADGNVIRTAEKEVISHHALAGSYGFRSASMFFEASENLIARNMRSGNGEFYTSSVYNALIVAGRTIKLADAEDYFSFGTPAECAACEKNSRFAAFLDNLGAI